MKPSKKLLEAIKRANLNENIAWLFCCAIFFKGKKILDELWEIGWINEENEHLYRIALVDIDPTTQEYVLRYPLIDIHVNTDFKSFLIELSKHSVFSGVKQRSLENTVEAQKAYEALSQSIENFDVQRLIKATVKYYQDTNEYVLKLSNFLSQKGWIYYTNYKEEKPVGLR